jgi:hypothetical protein
MDLGDGGFFDDEVAAHLGAGRDASRTDEEQDDGNAVKGHSNTLTSLLRRQRCRRFCTVPPAPFSHSPFSPSAIHTPAYPSPRQ